MFTFFHRRKKIVLEFFTDVHPVFECVPIVKSSKLIPKWWKQLPNLPMMEKLANPPKVNMRTCYGFKELFKRGVIVRNTGDYFIKSGEHLSIGCKHLPTTHPCGGGPESHVADQYKGAFTKYHHLKLKTPWIMSEKTGCSLLFIGAEWHLDNYPIKITPGILDCTLNQPININIMIPRTNPPTEMHLPFGLPMLQIIPITDNDIEVKNHLVTLEELKKIISSRAVSFSFQRMISLAKENKCPFH